MVVLTQVLSGCGVTIHELPLCSPIPGGYGAACDDLLTHNPETLNEAEWQARILEWQVKGWALECTNSDAIGNLKGELEQLCSKVTCNRETQQGVKLVLNALSKMQKVGTQALSLQ